jgi:hypothetical protein
MCKNLKRSKHMYPARNTINHPKKVNTGTTLVRSKSTIEENEVLFQVTLVSTTNISIKFKGRLKPTKPKQNNEN